MMLSKWRTALHGQWQWHNEWVNRIQQSLIWKPNGKQQQQQTRSALLLKKPDVSLLMFHCLRSPVDIWAKWAKCGVAGRDRGREGSMDLPHSKIQNQNIRRKHGYFMVRLTKRVDPPKMAIFHLKTCCLQKSCCCSILVPLSSWQHGKIDRWLNLIESRFSPLAAVQLQPWSSFVPVTADDPTQPLLVAAVQDVLHGVLQD